VVVRDVEEVAVTRPKPDVEQGMLMLQSADGEQRIAVSMPDWFQWLEIATAFTFASAAARQKLRVARRWLNK
jgi:hypothetical protein